MSTQNIHSITDLHDSATSGATHQSDSAQISPLYNAVKHTVRRYLYDLDGELPDDMYAMVLRQIEKPLLETVLEHTRGNQSRAAEYLGLNRGTLRKKLRLYGLA